MLSGKHRFLQLIIILVLFSAALLVAGTTGKIAGRVLDGDTREPLVGVNIVVKGTTLGATTDIEGYYTILTVSPGTHSIVASMVGYSSVTVNDIRVQIDQTATVNVELPQEAVRLGDIMVVAERSTLRKDVSTSVVAIQPDEIASLPVTSVTEVIGLQAGVEEGLAIRGGTDDQNLLQIDGISQRDPRDNSPITIMSLTSIQEVSVEKGGFNAEYGQVQSGLINIVGKEGDGAVFNGAMQIKYSSYAPKNFGMSIYDPNSMWNRPYLDPAVSWTGTENGAWDFYTQRQYPKFDGWNAISQRLLTDNDSTNDLSPAAAQRVWQWERRRRPKTDEPDYNIDASFGGPVPFISSALGNLRFFASYVLNREMFLMPLTRDDYKEYNWSLKVNSDISKDIKLMLSASTGRFYTSANNFEENFLNYPTGFGIRDNPNAYDPTFYFRSPISIAAMLTDERDGKIYSNGWYSAVEVGHTTLGGKLTTFITPSTYYDASVEHVNREYGVGPIAERDITKKYEIVPGYFVDEAPYGFSTSSLNSPISGMFLGGHTGELVDSSVVSSYKAKFDLTSQATNEHLLKFGVEFNTYSLKMDYTVTAFGQSTFFKEEWSPYQISGYAQDKIEAYGFISNIGIRLDVSNPNTEWVTVDPFDKYYARFDPTINYPKEKAKIDVAFSPRLGISHPITENSKLYFNYGHFKQTPSYEQMYRIGRSPTNSITNLGDPNLVQAKTVAYELGYDHVLFESYLLQIQGFYRDISNLQGITNYNSDRKIIRYAKATNNNYSDVRGVELTFKKTEGSWMRGFLTYNYQVNTNGAFGKATIDEDPTQQRQNDQNTQALYQTKPIAQPHARLSLTFLTSKEYGGSAIGTNLLGNWSLNILGDWRAGAYVNYTHGDQVPEEYRNIPTAQVSDYFNINLRINKVIDIAGLNLMVFMEVRNLLNHKILSGEGFYDPFDQQFYYESLHLPESPAYDNIPGDDRIGEYNRAGYYQPVEQSGNVFSESASTIHTEAIYYNRPTKQYMQYVNGNWVEVEKSRMQKILDDKAYIDMPNNTSFNFLNPRQIFFGVNLSF